MKTYRLPVDVEIDEDGVYKSMSSDGVTIDEALFELTEVVEMCLEE
jgi:predicted RNase H-like HicB family nuclease